VGNGLTLLVQTSKARPAQQVTPAMVFFADGAALEITVALESDGHFICHKATHLSSSDQAFQAWAWQR
jgi:protein associated with RNAse G/E